MASRDKAVVRRLGEGRVPREILHKVKIGFPTHGHQSLVLKRDFFDGGYVEDVFDLTKQGREQLTTDKNMFFAARMASVEVFGRLFEYGQTPEEVTAHLRAFGRIDPPLHTRWAIT
jgi:hypothetical protein